MTTGVHSKLGEPDGGFRRRRRCAISRARACRSQWIDGDTGSLLDRTMDFADVDCGLKTTGKRERRTNPSKNESLFFTEQSRIYILAIETVLAPVKLEHDKFSLVLRN